MTRTTTKTHKNAVRSILLLERHQRSVFKYLEKLKSYRCEPTDYNCFIVVRQLKDGLVQLALDQKKLLDKVREKSRLNLEELRKIETHEKRFQQLEVEMAAYLSLMKTHY